MRGEMAVNVLQIEFSRIVFHTSQKEHATEVLKSPDVILICYSELLVSLSAYSHAFICSFSSKTIKFGSLGIFL